MEDFYASIVRNSGMDPDDQVLAVCAGSYDKDVLSSSGMRNVIISNLSPHAGEREYAPFPWRYEDVEALSISDNSVDWCVVHAGLHHCASPHKGLCEMLRVARKGIIVIESRDSLLVRIAGAMGLSNEYELEIAALSNGKSGGYRNTNIPNYIYRWTERDVEKTVRTYIPEREPDIEYFYHYRLPLGSISMSRSISKRAIVHLAKFFLRAFELIAKKQANCFGFVVRKSQPLHPWLIEDNGDTVVNMTYVKKLYSPEAYRPGPT